jgi:hypothetical protein
MVYAVLGIPRSGTSLLSGILHNLGIFMGKEWLPMFGEGWQPENMFIDKEFNSLHLKLMADVLPTHNTRIKQEYLNEYNELISKREAEYTHWGVKCHYLPFLWQHFLNACKSEVYLLKTWRLMDESVRSYSAITDIDYASSKRELETWVEPMEIIWKEFSGSKLEVRFVDVINSPKEQVAEIARFAGVSVTNEAVSLVKPDWKRY